VLAIFLLLDLGISWLAGLASNVALDEFSACENPRIDNSALETYLELVRVNKGPAEVHLSTNKHMGLVNDDLAADFALALQRNTKLRCFALGLVSLAGLRSIFNDLAGMKRELVIMYPYLGGFTSEDAATLLQSVKESTSIICSLFIDGKNPKDAVTGEVDPLLE